MPRNRPIAIHLGLPKTATTTLQRRLFGRHSAIEFLGKRAGRTETGNRRVFGSDAARRLAEQLFWDHADLIDLAKAKRVYVEEILTQCEPGRLPVYSFEGLAALGLDQRHRIAGNLRAVFPVCKVVIGIRRPTDLVEAVYFQRLKRRHFGAEARRFEFLQAVSPEAWLASVVRGQELANHLDYARTIRIFVEALGRESVGVFALEQLDANSSAFAEDLCRFLEIDVDEGRKLLAEGRENIRLTREAAVRMARFERIGPGALVYALAGRKIRKRLSGIRRGADGEAAGLSISRSARASIEDLTRAGNAWIAGEWNLPLEEYGYPV